jgi:hypothetical protein
MKKNLLFVAVMMLFITEGYSQASFNTGALEVNVNEYGRIRLFTPDATRHLQRASILVGTSPTTVFDYVLDAEELEPTVLVTDPLLSDYEIYGAYDNAYSSLPPDVIVKLNAYGWENGAYTIVKFNVQNDEGVEINASAGLDIIPELNQEYGFDSVSYLAAEEFIRFHRGAHVNMGIRLLSASLSSLYSFEWYDEYSVDADYWTWMNYGSLQPLYASNTADGPVTITAQNPAALAPGQSFDVFYALALGDDQEAMLANIAAAVEKYESLFTSVDDNILSGKGFSLGKNYPNPFSQSTTITYQLPDDGFVTLKVYDLVGNEVATIINAVQAKGTHRVQYDAPGLGSGVYYYTLRFNDQVRSGKMNVIR